MCVKWYHGHAHYSQKHIHVGYYVGNCLRLFAVVCNIVMMMAVVVYGVSSCNAIHHGSVINL